MCQPPINFNVNEIPINPSNTAFLSPIMLKGKHKKYIQAKPKKQTIVAK